MTSKVELSDDMIDYIDEQIKYGRLDPNCKICLEVFYPEIYKGKRLHEIFLFAPRHKASDRCKSGKHNHCTCDNCF